MPENYRPSVLKFSLEEAVSFRKGDDIGELISISVEPNVAIQDSDHYISIRGKLEMFGEYKKLHQEEEEEILSFSGEKYAQVRDAEVEGVSEFVYDFPVDITIPKTRIRNLEELALKVDSFDYRLANPNCLELSTDLSVTGVYEEYFERDRTDEEITEYTPYENSYEGLTPFSLEEEEEDSFSVTVRKTEKEEDSAENSNLPIFEQPEQPEALEMRGTGEWRSSFETPVYSTMSSNPINLGETESEDASDDEESEPEVDSYSLEREELEPEEEEFPLFRDEEEELEEYEDDDDYEEVRELADEETESRHRESREGKSIHYQAHSEDETKKKDISLVEFFARKEEEERKAKVQVYIVQEDDTLSEIAERYNVNVSQIVRLNRIDSHQELTKGQVLYIKANVEKPY